MGEGEGWIRIGRWEWVSWSGLEGWRVCRGSGGKREGELDGLASDEGVG